jgi:transcriptional regulator with XRE-family HTH domain
VKLKEWLSNEGLTQEAFAKLLGSDQGHISDLVLGKVRPRLDSVARVEEVTKGAVKAQDWLEPKKQKVRVEKLKAAVRKAVR